MKSPKNDQNSEGEVGLAVISVLMLIAAIIVWSIYFFFNWTSP